MQNVNNVSLSVKSSWTKEEDKIFETALVFICDNDQCRWEKIAAILPGKSAKEVEEHYLDLVLDLEAIEAGLIEPPNYVDDVSMKKKGQSSKQKKATKRWDEEEHRRFLDGLKKEGKGGWKGIAEKYVVTKDASQVASHAQKYFEHLEKENKNENGKKKKKKKRPSIFDITIQ